MKNLLLTIAAAALLLLTSCQRDELQGGSISGEEVTVSISAVVPGDGGAVVKSAEDPGNGSEVNRCILEVYLLEGEDGSATASLYGTRHIVKMQDKKASFEDLNLITGQKYRLVLWADHVENPESGLETDLYYDTESLPSISYKSGTEYESNDDSRDAFFKVEEFEVDGPEDRTVSLTRPFGQINIITTDYGLIPSTHSDLLPVKIKLAFPSIPTSIDLVNGTVNDMDKVTTSTAVDIAGLDVDGEEDSKQLSFDYILAPAEGQTVVSEFTMSFLKDDGTTPVAKDYTFENIPVQRNYRTNVSGALLTDRAGVDVKVEPGFDCDEEVIDGKLVISSVDRLMNALENGGRVMLAQDMEIDRRSEEITGPDDDPNRIVVEKDVEIDLNGHKLTLKGESRMAANNAEIRISNGYIESESQSAEIFRFFANEGGKVVVEDVEMNVPGTTGVGFNPGANNARLEVRNSTIVAEKYAVGTNAAKPVSGAEIVIENSTLKAQTPILVNIDANTKITNCTFEGTVQGGLFRGGQYEVTGSTFILNSSTEQSGETYLDKNWADGNNVPGAALVVGNRTSDAYQYPTVLKISDSKLQSKGTGSSPAVYVYANQGGEGLGVTIDYDGCEFTGDFEVASGNVTVNGSEFAAAGQSASIGNVESLKDAIASLGTGDGKIQHLQMTLSEDITLSDSDIASGFAPAGTSVGMDLAGHTMNLDASVIADNSSIAFFDGTILTQNLSAVNDHALSVGTNGTLTLDGITLESNGSGVAVNGATSGGTLTVRNSKITTAAYGVATNASAPESKNVTITLENSEFTGSDPVFINIPCTLNMTGCTLNGNMHGMVIRGGTANVENCNISLTYPENKSSEDAKRMADYFQSTNWATGNAVNIAAVTVGNKVAEGNSSYKYPSVLNIKNCVVESAGIHADLFPALYVWANQETENGVTITYDGDTKFYGDRIYGNNGANITVNRAAAVSDEGDTRP